MSLAWGCCWLLCWFFFFGFLLNHYVTSSFGKILKTFESEFPLLKLFIFLCEIWWIFSKRWRSVKDGRPCRLSPYADKCIRVLWLEKISMIFLWKIMCKAEWLFIFLLSYGMGGFTLLVQRNLSLPLICQWTKSHEFGITGWSERESKDSHWNLTGIFLAQSTALFKHLWNRLSSAEGRSLVLQRPWFPSRWESWHCSFLFQFLGKKLTSPFTMIEFPACFRTITFCDAVFLLLKSDLKNPPSLFDFSSNKESFFNSCHSWILWDRFCGDFQWKNVFWVSLSMSLRMMMDFLV